jgi:hypothetical protein
MAQPAIQTKARDSAAPQPAIDRDHLARMTFGDIGLMHEVLELFDRQARDVLARLRGGGSDTAALAHALRGAASGIGAWGVVRAAAACERTGSPAERSLALDDLAQAVAEARADIARVLAAARPAPKG